MRPGVGTTPVRVLCGTHGNERLGPKLHELLEREPIPGVQSRIAHPEAVKQGLRFLGVSQLRQHYPGSQYGDPEDQAAYWNMQWLGSEAGSESSLVIDIHNTTASPKSYLAVGPQVLRAAIVSGWMLGYNKGIVQDEPFIRTVPNAIAIEASCLSDSDERVTAKKLHAGLGELALRDRQDLLAQYEEAVASMSFYTQREICTLGPGGALADTLPLLEAVPSGEAFTAINLPDELRAMLDITDGTEVFYDYWGHQNMSPERPDLGCTSDGTPRRLYFGSYFMQVDPPICDGAWAQFTPQLP